MSFKGLMITVGISLASSILPASAQNHYNLQEALRAAKESNPILKTQQFNRAIADADVVSSQLRPNPKLNNQSLLLLKPSLYPNNTDWYSPQNRQVWWQLTKVIQTPSLRKSKIEYAQQNTILSQKVYNEVVRNVLQDVALKWLDVWMAKKQLDILQIAKNNTDSLATINRIRLDKQVITSTDLIRTELLANQYALLQKTNEQIYKSELSNLKFLLGTTEEDIDIDFNDNFAFAYSSDLDSLLQQTLINRTDVLASKSTIKVADANINLQKALAIPQPELGVIYNPQNTIPYFGIYGTIELPFFSRNQGEIQKSKVQKQQAEQGLQTTLFQIQIELSIAYKSYLLQKQNIQNFKDLLSKSETILSSVKYSYLHGGTTIVDFLEAQRSWLDTQQQYYNSLQQYRQSYIRLLYTSGLINKMAQ
jgi:cobalt-zinc-cadmium efflux system outer membrane protein